MSADPRTADHLDAGYTLPRLTRRHALLGAAALLTPLAPRPLIAAPGDAPIPRGTIRLDSNENPYGPSPAAHRASVRMSQGGVDLYA